jgi:hypothetical protein
MLIASVMSSVSVVQKFIGLMCPIDGKFFPFYGKPIMRQLTSLIESNYRKPVCTLPLVSGASFSYDGLDRTPFRDGFTITCWIQLESANPNYKPQLLTMSDEKGFALRISLHSETVILYATVDGHE